MENPVTSNSTKLTKSINREDAQRWSLSPKQRSSWYDKLLPEQKACADFSLTQSSVCLFCKQRTGKTYITMAVLEKLGWPNVLVVAPLTTVNTVWAKALSNSEYEVVRDLQELKKASKKVALVTHYQAFVKIASKLAKFAWEVIVMDESQGLKARNSKQSKAAKRLRQIGRRIALSGTPIDEGEIDIWAQMRFVEPSVLGDRWSDFATEYCYQTGYMGKVWKFNPKKKQQFLEVLKPYIYRLDTTFLGLKPIEFHSVPVHLLGRQRVLYDQMQEKGIVTIGDCAITAPLEVTARVKLEQMTGGHVLTEDGYPFTVGNAKVRKLAWLIPRLKPPVVVFCQFLHEMPLVGEVLHKTFKRVGYLNGSVKDTDQDKRRTNLIADFQSGLYDALVCQVRTGGVGIDLTRSSSLVFYSLNYSFIDFEQVIYRCYGMNQKDVLKVYFLYAVDSVDEEKLDLIESKKSTAYSIVSHFEKGNSNG